MSLASKMKLASAKRLAISFSVKRYLFSTSSRSCNREVQSNPPKSSDIERDMIGPPNQISNLRPMVFHIPENESELERKYRLERAEVQRWNENFWVDHNSAFLKEGTEFRKKSLELSPDKEKKSLSAEEMSEFYKAFLDKNWKRHVLYNFQWYRKNFSLLYLSFKVQISRLLK